MNFYSTWVNYYDEVFPVNKSQVTFFNSKQVRNQGSDFVLDIGCGTGSLTVEIAKYCDKVFAFDLNPDMVNIAEDKAKSFSNISFKTESMLNMGSFLNHESFSTIICFGNTLVHLNSIQEIKLVLDQIFNLLAPCGAFLLQIINYDRILNQNINSLPTIETEHVTLERKYFHNIEKNKIEFTINLIVNKTKEIYSATTDLYPLRKEELKEAMHDSGFTDLEFYGSFDQSPLNKNSIQLVVKAIKN